MTTIGKISTYSRANGGFRIDGGVTQFWATKPQAVEAAKSIGWPVNSVQPVYTRFQKGYGLGWGITKSGLVSKVEWAELSAQRATQPSTTMHKPWHCSLGKGCVYGWNPSSLHACACNPTCEPSEVYKARALQQDVP